jgi:hypothetical protein
VSSGVLGPPFAKKEIQIFRGHLSGLLFGDL